MRFETAGAPHVPPPTSVQGVMRTVIIALVPGVLAHVWYFGLGILVQIVLAVAFALVFEAIMLKLRNRPLRPFLTDFSAPITAVLYCLCLPPIMPWWTVAVGMLFAIVIAKHLYGGLGYNIFNPAMVGFIVVLIAFPVHATTWPLPQPLLDVQFGLGDILHRIFTGSFPVELNVDAVTEATPLDKLRTGHAEGVMLSEIRRDPIFGHFGGVGWEWIAGWYGIGGLFLMYRRVISWHVPVAMLGTVIAVTLPLYVLDPYNNPFPLEQIFSGGMLLGAFFIATDPVSGSTTPRGRLIFGAGVALLVMTIRTWGGYPDGVGFSVLLMNMAVPLIDRYTKPRVYGHE